MNQTLMIGLVGLITAGAVLLLLVVGSAGMKFWRGKFTANAQSQLEDSFIFMDTSRLFYGTCAAVVLVPILIWALTGNGFFALVGAVLSLAGPGISFRMMRARRRDNIVKQLPDALLLLSSSLRAGTSLQIGLDLAVRETPAPLSQELGVVVREQRLGLALEDSLETLAARLKLEEIQLVVSAMTIARDVGGNLAETLDRLAATLRAKAVMEGKIRALTSQGKMQGWIVGALPIFMMVILTKMQPEAMAPLYNTIIGWCVLGVMGILELLGFFMIRKIVNIDV